MSGWKKVYEHTDGRGLYLGVVFFDGDRVIAENRHTRLYYPFASLSDGETFLRLRHRQGKWKEVAA